MELKVSAAAVNKTTFMDTLLKVCLAINQLKPSDNTIHWQDIKKGTHRIVLTSPEMMEHPKLQKLISTPKFASCIGAFIIGKAHCIMQWGGNFRPEYSKLNKFCVLAPCPVPFLVTSATFMPQALAQTHQNLCIEILQSFHLNLSNDHRSIKQEMWLMKSASDYAALDFMVTEATTRDDLPQAIIFVNDIAKTHAIAHQLHMVVGPALCDKIVILHAWQGEFLKSETWLRFKDNKARILVATEAAAIVHQLQTEQILYRS